MKIAVLGAGSLGCAMGGALALAGNEVWLINRSPTQVDAIARDGLKIRAGTAPDALETIAHPHAVTTAAPVGVADLVIVLVKSFHTREAIAASFTLIGPKTTVLSLQNGLGHEDILAEVVGKEKLLAGKTYVGGLLIAPGVVVSGTVGKETIIGELDGTLSLRATQIAETFCAAGLQTIVSLNIMGIIWDKILVNVATGAVSGISGLPYGELYQVPELEATAIAAVKEAMAVAQAGGIALSFIDPRAPWVKAGAGLPYEFKASMLQSLEKGSITEIDFINGAVVCAGQKWGVPTPVNTALVACIKGIERRLFPLRKSKSSTQNTCGATVLNSEH